MRVHQDNSALPKFRVGDRVEVRSAEEILLTIDRNGALDRMPFMPEMLRFCGQQFTIIKRAEKACTASDNTVRQVKGAVHLDGVRCDGSAHGGCEARCLLYWKEEWLKPVALPGYKKVEPYDGGCAERKEISFETWKMIGELNRNTTRPPGHRGFSESYYCQATAIPEFGEALSPWDFAQYARDLKSGNVKLTELLRGLAVSAVRKVRFGLIDSWRPQETTGMRTPGSNPEFGPGDLVEIRPASEIGATLDHRGRNRGLSFTPEMKELCGRRFRVARRIHKIIDERTGQMVRLVGGCLILEGAICRGDRHRFCPRMSHLYWRDIWLRGVRAAAPTRLAQIGVVSAPRPAEAVPTSARRAASAAE
jgi:hypothetical protein